ncbi:MAG: hypothetical protein M0Z46_02220 [Actinomycetota bacterium]|nr:hypothetical protein [Actinomycetota bacterium]
MTLPSNVTRDTTTLRSVVPDFHSHYGIATIAFVAARRLIAEADLSEVSGARFDYVLATRVRGLLGGGSLKTQDTEPPAVGAVG